MKQEYREGTRVYENGGEDVVVNRIIEGWKVRQELNGWGSRTVAKRFE